ncbi:MAG: hypothetical protein QF437_16505, partial [Planctomycetota bacterium]|nr:hypothetical protein [Planctomycetota bacterium]
GDARLTLLADGAGLAEKDYPYFIPAWLPPTKGRGFETVSFFWSLYKGTSMLKLQWQPGVMWGKPRPEDDDYGTVQVDAIELVKVEPIAT